VYQSFQEMVAINLDSRGLIWYHILNSAGQ
jgi:hypothetical protein